MENILEKSVQNRNTKKRDLILQCFNESKIKHLTAEDLFELARKKDNQIGIATIYRNLKFLEEQSIIKKAEIPSSIACYELNCGADTHSHHHLICQTCGVISDFEEDLLDNVEKSIESKNGFLIKDHHVLFYGTCKKCR